MDNPELAQLKLENLVEIVSDIGSESRLLEEKAVSLAKYEIAAQREPWQYGSVIKNLKIEISSLKHKLKELKKDYNGLLNTMSEIE